MIDKNLKISEVSEDDNGQKSGSQSSSSIDLEGNQKHGRTEEVTLSRRLKSRHLQMIAIGMHIVRTTLDMH